MESNDSLPQPSDPNDVTTMGQKETSVPRFMKCPVSLDVMKDPVVVRPSGITYNRKNICTSMLAHPKRRSCVEGTLDKLHYTRNMDVGQAIMGILRDDAYEPYDDASSVDMYHAAWDNMPAVRDDATPLGHHENDQFEKVEALLYGMNTELIDWRQAAVLANSKPQDPIMLLFKARLLHLNNEKQAAQDATSQAVSCGLAQLAQAGNARAQCNLGYMYFGGLGVPQDYGKALEWLNKAAMQGHADAQRKLGNMYQRCQGVAKDYSKALEWYTKAAKQGNAVAQNNLGVMYQDGHGVAQDHGKAVEWYSKAAQQGDTKAQYHLGVMYRRGQGVAKDYSKAMEWFTKAAQQGHAKAQNELGAMYHYGKGVARDSGQAVEWYTKAAQQGHARSQNNLGVMYYGGLGVAEDYDKALEWFTKAAQQGDADAQCNLGAMYDDGQGVTQDHGKALDWFKKSAQQGNTVVQFQCNMYDLGQSVTKFCGGALEWFREPAQHIEATTKEKLREPLLPTCNTQVFT